MCFYIPSTPNPASGILILAPRHEVTELSMSIDESMKVIISGGLVSPHGISETKKQESLPAD